MKSEKKIYRSKWTNPRNYVFVFVLALSLLAGNASAQVAASVTGQVKDSSGAAIAGANVTVKNTETGLTRSAESNESGNYRILPLPVGAYEVTTEKAGFKKALQKDVTLVVAQEAVINVTLEVGNVEQQVTVEAENLIVNTTLAPTSGLVSQTQVKDLPLNGRSWDQLLTLNPAVNNFSSTANTSAATTGSQLFTVTGRRYEENRFLMNGIDYVGSDMMGVDPQPYGASGKLLGVDAVREFNLVTDAYGAEYGKRPGGQVLIVTTSGTNGLHGDAFEYIRNDKFDARNFFDPAFSPTTGVAVGAPPFKRNQFGGSLGGALRKDKMFLFGNYEGFRQRLGISSNPIVPDNIVRTTGAIPDPCTGVYSVPANFKPGMLPIVQSYFVAPNAASVEQMIQAPAKVNNVPCANAGKLIPTGLVSVKSSPSQAINEDFGIVRFDYNISPKDSFNSNYLMDDGLSLQPGRNPVSQAVIPQRAQLFSIQETHIFSSNLVNVFNVGFSRAWQTQTNPPYTPFPAAANFEKGNAAGSGYPGKVTVGPSTSVNGGNNVITGTIVALALSQHRNYTTGTDDVHYIHGNHSLSFGVWVQRLANNFNGGSPNGSAAFDTLLTVVTDAPRQWQINPTPTAQGGRVTQGAWYVQDEIKLRPNLSFRIGLRDEMTSNYHEQYGRFSNYIPINGVPQTLPVIGPSPFLENNASALWSPRAGIAWDPTGSGKWSIRAGAGEYYNMQDSILFSLSTVWPFNGRQQIKSPAGGLLGCSITLGASNFCPGAVATINPIIPADLTTASLAVPCTAKGVPAGCATYALGGIDPYMKIPSVAEWNLTIEHQITKDFGVRVAYSGSQSVHGAVPVNYNTIPSQTCTLAAGCPTIANTVANPAVAPVGALYIPAGATVPNPLLASGSQLLYEANSNYNGISASVVKRSAHGLTLRTNYTYAKALNLATSGGATEPQILDASHLALSKGVAGFNVLHQFSSNFTYEMPFGKGRRFAGSASGLKEQLIGGWQWNGIISAQTGFPFTPLAASNISGNGDSAGNPDVVSYNPAFTGKLYLDPRTSQNQNMFDANAFVLPIAGTFGNVSRGALIGPGLVSVDTSIFKRFNITERANLEFRSEFFNIINHTNFGPPNSSVFAGTLPSSSAGQILITSTPSRQIQFALKLAF